MSFAEFLAGPAPAARVPAPVRALWHDARGEWDQAHALVQSDPGAAAAWVHAYLHRREGDDTNAGYWYRRAGRTPPGKNFSLDDERAAIGEALLGEPG
ncbi:MAG: hypothetical protein JSR48_08045 [Verrucomicrobia bacterium]|nr:hypothetical protein [Verrucomicrobiota bacterium]